MNNIPIHTQATYYYYCTVINNLSRDDTLLIGKELICYYLQQKKTLLTMFLKDSDADFVISKNIALDKHLLTTRLQSLYDNPTVPRKPLHDLLLLIVKRLFEDKSGFYLIVKDSNEQAEIVKQWLKSFDCYQS